MAAPTHSSLQRASAACQSAGIAADFICESFNNFLRLAPNDETFAASKHSRPLTIPSVPIRANMGRRGIG